MNRFDFMLSLEPVYFVKPGDDLKKVARRLLPRSTDKSNEAAIQAKIRELILYNPRLNKKSNFRMGNLLTPGQVLSLTLPEYLKGFYPYSQLERQCISQDFDDSSILNSPFNIQLIQYQLAREQAVLGMDPQLRQYYQDYSGSDEAHHQEIFKRVGFLAAMKIMEINNMDAIQMALHTGHNVAKLFKTHEILNEVADFERYLDKNVGLARKGKLNLRMFKSNAHGRIAKIEGLINERMPTLYTEFNQAIDKQISGIRRFNTRMAKTGAVLPRLGRQYTNSANAFAAFSKIKIVNGVARVLLIVDVGVRVSKVIAARNHTEEAFIEASSLAGAVGGSAVVSWAVCSAALSLPTASTSIFICGLVAGVIGGWLGETGLKAGAEALYETYIEPTLVTP